ncbi:hypothetical protein CEXT_578231, partial [Caerostris extrusa]
RLRQKPDSPPEDVIAYLQISRLEAYSFIARIQFSFALALTDAALA